MLPVLADLEWTTQSAAYLVQLPGFTAVNQEVLKSPGLLGLAVWRGTLLYPFTALCFESSHSVVPGTWKSKANREARRREVEAKTSKDRGRQV